MSYFPVIRHADPSEAMDLAALGFVAWEQSILPLYHERDSSRESLMNQLAGYCQDRIQDVIVAESRGEVLGWCSRQRGKAYIPYLFVTPHLQGQGIGGLLLKRMESIFELEGHAVSQLETPADHVQAVKFYENQGYHILAMKLDGRGAHKPYMSVRLEKQLRPFRGPVGDE
ncbi:GNAT family N-acetyltransferase [Mariluticola halotolerans]|uniref:GNAT family N-acetyltransferase n=1 Tax=Mariluticola halotolerans TaxID=2909283 RepID=UPI0026E3AC5A|nr:GNAT family N-acetyltransferase [Mariluticola halotolerans]UJQ95208.1 GNAT family N-acetyltransferase [Mariluticola halotolerans]